MLKLRAAASIRIANRRSIVRDHTSYAANGEAFRPAVLAELAGLVGWTLPKPAMVVVDNARARRERLARLLVAWRLVIGSLVVAGIVLPLLDVLGRDAARTPPRGSVSAPAGSRRCSATTPARGRGRAVDYVVAAAVLMLVAWAIYGLGVIPWDWLARRRARRLFHPSRPCGSEAAGSPVPFPFRRIQGLAVRYAERAERKGGWDSKPPRRGGSRSTACATSSGGSTSTTRRPSTRRSVRCTRHA